MKFALRLLSSFAALALLGVLAAACGGSGGGGGNGSVPGDAVAVVGNTEISRQEFNLMLDASKRSYKQNKQSFPNAGTAEYAALRNQILQFLVQRVEFEARAKDDLGIEISDKQVEDRLTQIKKQFFGGSEERYLKRIQSQGLTDSQVHDQIKSQLLSEEIFKKVTSDVQVSQKEIQDYYNKNKSQYQEKESRDVRHILVKTKAEADKLERQLKNGADFAKLARKFSTDTTSKPLGGRLPGGISRGQTLPPFDKMAFSLKTKEISPPVHTQYGWHIIQPLSPVRPARTTPLSEREDQIKQQLLQQKKNEALTKWVDETKKEFASRISYAPGFAPSSGLAGGSTQPATTTG